MSFHEKIIAEKYLIIKQLGQGGMSRVFQVFDIRLKKYWAMKTVEKNAGADGLFISGLYSEVAFLKKIEHPNIPRIVDLIELPEVIYLVMDLVEGVSLEQLLLECNVIPETTVVDWGLQLCEALGYLHQQSPPIIYRDMKPGNVMLQQNGIIKLIDFGISREVKDVAPNDTVCLGTRGYAAPEQFGKAKQSDARTDVYGLGVLLHQLLTGRNPSEHSYEIVPIRSIEISLSSWLEKTIIKATKADPNKRFQNCVEFAAALNHFDKIGAMHHKKQRVQYLKICLLFVLSLFSLAIIVSFYHEIVQELQRLSQKIMNRQIIDDLKEFFSFLIK